MTDFVDEPDAIAQMKTMLEDHWKGFQEVPIPQIIVANDADDPRLRADNWAGDIVVIKMDGMEQLKQRYNFSYYDRVFPIVIEVYTKESRQRLRNLGKAIRSIINDNIHSFPSYQLIRYKGMDEAVEDSLNVWRGRFRFQLESNAVCVESLET
jgi:hypothetical protein